MKKAHIKRFLYGVKNERKLYLKKILTFGVLYNKEHLVWKKDILEFAFSALLDYFGTCKIHANLQSLMILKIEGEQLLSFYC